MRILPECVPCFFEDIIEAMRLLGSSRADIDAVISESLEYCSRNFEKNEPPSYYITEMHRIIKRRLSLDMPFSELRQQCLALCMELAKSIAREAGGYFGAQRLKFLSRWAIAANTLDFRSAGAGYGVTMEKIEKILRKSFTAGLAVDDTDAIYNVVTKAKNVVYIPDNVGELPFDKMLVADIKKAGAKVTVPFRGGPITSDVVMTDADTVNMAEAADVLMISGPDTLGVSFKEMSEEFRNVLAAADVIIAKGQANFYVMSEFCGNYPNATVVSLMATKCKFVSRLFNNEEKINCAVVLKSAGGSPRFGA
jgi:damage-control phosphatase, subfamily I